MTLFRQRFDAELLRRRLSPLLDDPGWERGRQGTGYRRLDLRARRDVPSVEALADALSIVAPPRADFHDAWLLAYDVGDFIAPHRDPPLGEGLGHFRLNVLVEAGEGGELSLDGEPVTLAPGDAVLFRPDEVVHAVSPVLRGRRLVWSIGTNRPVSTPT